MTVAWVIGAGGTLGSALCRALAQAQTRRFTPSARIDWGDERVSSRQLATAVDAFAGEVQATAQDWQIYWAAGQGTMGSSRDDMARESRLLASVLRAISGHDVLTQTAGTLLLASSAGAIYAGSQSEIITEATAIAPTTDYARGKLEHERQLQDFAANYPNVAVAIARISTVYGPRPLPGKRQGLIAEMAHRIIRNQPVHIYVPLDTIRDYIAVDDAADALVQFAQFHAGQSGAFVKIIASEQSTTISEIAAIFKKIAHRVPRIVTSGCALTDLYRRRIQFRSTADTAIAARPRTRLVVGIAQVMAAARLALARGPEVQ